MKKWVYKLVCSNPECRYMVIDEFKWESCPRCENPFIVVDRWYGGR